MKTNPNDLLNEPKKYSESININGFECIQGGLTKREYFATMAMCGILSSGMVMHDNGKSLDVSLEVITAASVDIADCLILQLNKETT